MGFSPLISISAQTAKKLCRIKMFFFIFIRSFLFIDEFMQLLYRKSSLNATNYGDSPLYLMIH